MRWANEPDRLEAGPPGGTGFQPVAVRWEEAPFSGAVSKPVPSTVEGGGFGQAMDCNGLVLGLDRYAH